MLGGKNPRGGATPQGCIGAAAALATDAHRDPAHSTRPRGTHGEQGQVEGDQLCPKLFPSPRQAPGATPELGVEKAGATAGY